MPRSALAVLPVLGFVCLAGQCMAQQTPPIAPRTVETPVPPRVQLNSPPQSPDVPGRPLTAEEAARIALRRQPSLVIARAAIEAARGRTQQVRSGLLPTLSVSGSYTNVSSLYGGGTTAVTAGSGTGVTTGNGTGSTGTGTTGSTGTGTTGTGGTGTGSTGTGVGSGNPGGTDTGSTGTGTTGNTGTGSTGSTGTGATGTGSTGTGSTGPTTVTPLGSNTGSTSTGFLAAATVRQLIFDFNHTRDLVRQSAALERAAEQNYTTTQYNLIYQTKLAFYLLQQNERLVAVNEGNVANRESQLALTRARLNSGLGLPSDVVQAETAVSDAVNALVIARNNAEIARVNLALTLGVDPRTPIQVADTTEPVPASTEVNTLVQTALRQRPEIRSAEETIRSTRFGVSAARTTNAPSVSGNLGVSTRGNDDPFNTGTFSVGASIQFSPFDGGLTQGRVREARANLQSAQAQLVSTQLTVTSDVSQAYLNLMSAEQRVVTAQAGVVNAQEGVRIAEGRYRTGLGQFLDIINAQAFLITEQTNLANAQAQREEARAALNRAIGQPLP